MPQLEQLLEVYQSQWFWLILVIAAIYFGIGHGMLPKIDATVDARDRKIAEDLAAAERAHSEADQTEEKWRGDIANAKADAAARAAKAKTKAAEDAAKRLAKADAEIDVKMADADAELSRALTKALKTIDGIAAEAAQDIVAKVSGAKVSAAEAGKAVKAVLSNG
ncbi:MAG: ATPase [Sphingorhabdus sp.]